MKLLRTLPLLRPVRNQVFPRTTFNVPTPKQENYSQVDRNVKKGSPAPFAYHDTFVYPEDYEPWNFSYRGIWVLLGAFAILNYSLYAYERSYLNRTGRSERPKDRVYYQP